MKVFSVMLFLTAVVLVSFNRCSKDEETKDGMLSGILLNWSGFDGCGWVIELDDNQYVEPRNLTDFNLTLTDSMQVSLRYHIADNQASDCMAGTVVDLIEIVEK